MPRSRIPAPLAFEGEYVIVIYIYIIYVHSIRYHKDGNLPDVVEQTIAKKPLAAAAFSACIWYFQEALIDKHVMSNAKFSTSVAGHESETVQLDASAIENLEIFQNSQGGRKGTLFQVLDHCASPYGRRLLRKWVSRPLARCEAIKRRQVWLVFFFSVLAWLGLAWLGFDWLAPSLQ